MLLIIPLLRCTGFVDMETGTNPIDRSIAHLLFHRPSDASAMPTNDAVSLRSQGSVSCLHLYCHMLYAVCENLRLILWLLISRFVGLMLIHLWWPRHKFSRKITLPVQIKNADDGKQTRKKKMVSVSTIFVRCVEFWIDCNSECIIKLLGPNIDAGGWVRNFFVIGRFSSF